MMEREEVEGRMAGQGWSCGVNTSVAIKWKKMDAVNKTEERRRSRWGQS